MIEDVQEKTPRVKVPMWFDIKEIHGSQCLVLDIGQYMAGRTDQYGVDRATITLLRTLIPSLQKSLDEAVDRTPDASWEGLPAADSTHVNPHEDYVEQQRRLIG